MQQVRVLISEEEADPERLAVLTGYLRGELLLLDVEDVVVLLAGELPAGARGANASEVGGLLVSLGQAASGLQSVISAVRDWLGRSSEPRKVRLELDGDVLEISRASVAEQQQLIELFVSRHPAPGAAQ